MITAVNMFLSTTIREHGIPFDLKLDIPNKATIEAIKKRRRMMSDPTMPKYSSIDELKATLDIWNIA